MRTLQCVLLLLALGVTGLWAQNGARAPNILDGGSGNAPPITGPAPRLPDGKPDFSGIWLGGGPVADLGVGLKKGDTIPLLPAAEKLMKERKSSEDPEANCLPAGIPRVAPYPWTIATAPG